MLRAVLMLFDLPLGHRLFYCRLFFLSLLITQSKHERVGLDWTLGVRFQEAIEADDRSVQVNYFGSFQSARLILKGIFYRLRPKQFNTLKWIVFYHFCN
jgi:hypothetical protein